MHNPESHSVREVPRAGNQAESTTLRTAVYAFFRKYRRDLPWRRDVTPYKTFVSEIMLQQTQVDRVAPKFEAFIERFPDFVSLASAPLSDVLRMWQGLGYNRRALSLKKAAEQVVQNHGGALPCSTDELVGLPGIGPATAASIAAFAFNSPTVFLETNIRTVLIHHFFGDREYISDKELLPLVEQSLDRRNPRKWYSAMMDYGSHIKKEIGNLSRSSAHYQKQSRFEGSRRQTRGRILKELVKMSSCSEAHLAKVLSIEIAVVRSVAAELAAERLIEKTGRVFRIASGG